MNLTIKEDVGWTFQCKDDAEGKLWLVQRQVKAVLDNRSSHDFMVQGSKIYKYE